MRRAPAAAAAGDSRFGPDSAVRVAFWVGFYLFLIHLFLRSWELATGAPAITVPAFDFVAFWAAARLALAGEALAAFDPAALLAASNLAGGGPTNLRWLYPPGFLALVMPFGALPFWAAWCVFSLLSALALALAARVPAAPLPGGWRFLVASPMLLMGALPIGQVSALWTAALIAALWAMRRGRPPMAGLWIALLTLKPQLGLLIPVALAAERRWRILGWATALTAALVLASTLAFGAAYWPHFLAALVEITRHFEDGGVPVRRVVSAYGFARQLGLGHDAALWAQAPVTAFLAGAVAWTWRRTAVGADLKAALLCAAIPLATPYAFYYEMAITVAAAMFLFRDGFGRRPPGALWLFVVWLGPVPAVYMPCIAPVALVGPPIAMVTVVICLVRAWRQQAAARAAAARPA